MAHIQKIILLVLIVPLALFPGAVISYIMVTEELKFERSMWIPIGISVLGFCSFIFHFKTKNFYKLLAKEADLPKVDPLFWVLDIAFGVAYMAISFFLVYLMYNFQTNKNTFGLLVFVIPIFITG